MPISNAEFIDLLRCVLGLDPIPATICERNERDGDRLTTAEIQGQDLQDELRRRTIGAGSSNVGASGDTRLFFLKKLRR